MTDPAEHAFSPSAKGAQIRKGSRPFYAGMIMADRIDARLAAFAGQVRSFYLASASTDGQPYVQHRGGSAGFLKVLDEKRLAFADFRGNRQYISTGNFAENPKAFIFLMDYANRRRLKIWGKAHVIEGDAALNEALTMPGCTAKVEQAIVFTMTAWDQNCPQLLSAQEVAVLIAERDARIVELEAQLASLSHSGIL